MTLNGNSLLDFLEHQAYSSPGAIAIVDGEHRYSYQDVWNGAQNVARVLVDDGFLRGEHAALLSENSFAYVVSYYGVLLSGGVVVPLNSQAKIRDFQNWIRHSRAKVLLLSRNHREFKALSSECDDLQLFDIEKIAFERSQDKRALKFRPLNSDPASIIYTSGTTGHPKGVVLSHHNLASNVRSIVQYLELTSSDSVLCVLPFTYSYGNSVLHTHLAAGGTIVMGGNMAFPARIIEGLTRYQVSGLSGVPSTFALLLSRKHTTRFQLPSLRYLTQAGGPMSIELCGRLQTAFPSAKLFVMYGQTEATARLSYLPPDQLSVKPGSVGVPIPGVEIEVRDSMGDQMIAGTIGDIWARGDNVMQGYWDDPEATASVLISGWLKTGDIGRLDEDGYLYISGRSNDMIKTGSHRVSPVDIEEVILMIEGVSEAAVCGVQDELLGQAIRAYVVLAAGVTMSENSVLAHCRKHLALYKMPKSVEFVTLLPRTSSGKVQRHLLV